MTTIALLGAAGAGKSSFLTKLANGNFYPGYRATRGISSMSYGEHTIQDYAGQELLSLDLPKLQADKVFIFYDVTSRISYSQARALYKGLSHIKHKTLVACKADLADRKIPIHPEHLQYSNKIGAGWEQLVAML